MNTSASVRSLRAGTLLVAGLLALPAAGVAASVSWVPADPDLDDLDHHVMYTWRINNVNLNGNVVTGASLFFDNIRNWDTNPAQLFLHLLETARFGGVAQAVDEPNNQVPVVTIVDDFTMYGNPPAFSAAYDALVAPGTDTTFLASPTAYFAPPAVNTFSNVPTDYTYVFTPAQVATLQDYIENGNDFALGLDPDCHFFNDGVLFTLHHAPPPPVPEPLSITLLGLGLAGSFLRRRKR